MRIDTHGLTGARALAEHDGVPPERIAAVLDELRRDRLLYGEDGAIELTPTGRSLAARALAARLKLLTEALADESADRNPAVDDLLHRLARELTGERP